MCAHIVVRHQHEVTPHMMVKGREREKIERIGRVAALFCSSLEILGIIVADYCCITPSLSPFSFSLASHVLVLFSLLLAFSRRFILSPRLSFGLFLLLSVPASRGRMSIPREWLFPFVVVFAKSLRSVLYFQSSGRPENARRA